MHILCTVSWSLNHSPPGNSIMGIPFVEFSKNSLKCPQENPGFRGQSLLLFCWICYTFLISWMTWLLDSKSQDIGKAYLFSLKHFPLVVWLWQLFMDTEGHGGKVKKIIFISELLCVWHLTCVTSQCPKYVDIIISIFFSLQGRKGRWSHMLKGKKTKYSRLEFESMWVQF